MEFRTGFYLTKAKPTTGDFGGSPWLSLNIQARRASECVKMPEHTRLRVVLVNYSIIRMSVCSARYF